MTEKEIKEALSTRELVTFPKELDKKCTPEEFHKIMTSHNSDIPIQTVEFANHHNTKME
jgi:hypothetical protein